MGNCAALKKKKEEGGKKPETQKQEDDPTLEIKGSKDELKTKE
jgi:hypothetical protein